MSQLVANRIYCTTRLLSASTLLVGPDTEILLLLTAGTAGRRTEAATIRPGDNVQLRGFLFFTTSGLTPMESRLQKPEIRRWRTRAVHRPITVGLAGHWSVGAEDIDLGPGKAGIRSHQSQPACGSDRDSGIPRRRSHRVPAAQPRPHHRRRSVHFFQRKPVSSVYRRRTDFCRQLLD